MRFRTLMVTTLSIFLALAACSGTTHDPSSPDDGDPTTSDSNDDDSSNDSTDDSSDDDGDHSSLNSCSSSEDCNYFACTCEDGSTVNSRFCDNGSCMPAEDHCQEACRDLSDSDWTGRADYLDSSDSDDSGSGDSCNVTGTGSPTCNSCAENWCCTEVQTCTDSPSCRNYQDCMANGGTKSTCDRRYPAGSDPFWDLDSCLATNCEVSCG